MRTRYDILALGYISLVNSLVSNNYAIAYWLNFRKNSLITLMVDNNERIGGKMGLEQQIKDKLNRKDSERQKLINEIEKIESEVSNRGAKAVGGVAQWGCLGLLGLNLIVLAVALFLLSLIFTEAILFGVLSIVLGILMLIGAKGGGKRMETAGVAARQIRECKTQLANVEKEINQIRTLLDP